jgi:alginate O-acetyltransferase complex protein AlgI
MADSVSQALCMIRWSIQGFSLSQFNSSLLDLGIEARDYIIIIAGCIIVFIISVLKEKGIAIRESIAAKPLAVRWAAYYALIAVILIFGYIGATQGFIYANF